MSAKQTPISEEIYRTVVAGLLTEPRQRVIRSAAVIVVVVAAVGLWWYVSPWRWTRQAEALLARDPVQADVLAEAALAEGTSAASRAWLVRCRAQLALKHPLEAIGAFAQIAHPEECDPVAWCRLIEEAQAAEESLLADLAISAALKFRRERLHILSLALPVKVNALPEDEVAALLEELRGLAAQEAQAWRALGQTEQSRGRLAEAVEAYRQAVALSQVSQPVGLSSRRELAQLLIDLGQFSAAEPLITDVLRAFPAISEDQLRQAQWQRATGDRAGAKQRLNEVLEREPENLPARLLRGTLSSELDQLADAQADIEECLRIAPFHAEAHYRLSQILLREGNSATAAQHVREHRRLSELQLRVLEINRRRTAAPQDADLLLELASCLEALGQPQRATALRRNAETLRQSPGMVNPK